jgi:hypothetical protein
LYDAHNAIDSSGTQYPDGATANDAGSGRVKRPLQALGRARTRGSDYVPDVSEPGPPPPPSRAHPDRLVAVVSGLVATLALAVSTYNVHLQRQQIRAQVWPRLHFTFSNISGFTYNLQNSGVGPAIVENVCLLVDDKPMADWDEALHLLTGKEMNEAVTSFMTGKVFTPGEVMHPLELRNATDAALLNTQKKRLRVEICYCSTLQECWLLRSPRAPEPTERCRPCSRPFAG